MLRQMRSLYAKSNSLLRTFSHCSIDVKVTLFQNYCTALYCSFMWTDYKKSTFTKIRATFSNVFLKFGAMHFIYYINRSMATKVDSAYLGYWPTAHSVYVLWRELGSNSWRSGHRAAAFHLHHTCRHYKKILIENVLVFLGGALQVQCMQITISAALRLC